MRIRWTALATPGLLLVVACGGAAAPPIASPIQATASPLQSLMASLPATADASVVPATATPLIVIVPSAQPTASASASVSAGLDYQGDFGGKRIAGTIKYCGAAKNPYWGLDVAHASGDKAFVAYDIPPGSDTPVAGEIVTPFVVTEENPRIQGTGQFIAGPPPHFVLTIGDGTYDIALKTGHFCQGQ